MKNIIIIVAVFLVAASAAAGGMYWWQQRIFQQQLSDIKNQLSESEALRVKAEGEKLELERQNCKGTWENNMCVAPQYSIHIIAPKGGERLCLGDNFNIEWEHKGLETVILQLSNSIDTTYSLGGFPADFNETGGRGSGMYVWKIGEKPIVKEGYTYKIRASSGPVSMGGKWVIPEDTSGKFSIIDCRG